MSAVRAIFMAKKSFTKIQTSHKYNKNKTKSHIIQYIYFFKLTYDKKKSRTFSGIISLNMSFKEVTS